MANTDQPGDLKYATTHEWVRVDGDEATVGISDYAQDNLHEVVFVDLPWNGVGTLEVKAGEKFGEIDSVKSNSELVSPVSGTLIAVNDILKDAPETVNEQPYGDGWMLRVRLSAPSELDNLMDAAAYTKFLKTPGH